MRAIGPEADEDTRIYFTVVREMLRRGFIDAEEGLEYFAAIDPLMYRYPAVDPQSLRKAVIEAMPQH